MERPTVGIWSDPNALALGLAEKLLANFCNVVVVSKNIKTWQNLTGHFSNSSHFIIKAGEENLKGLDYSIVLFTCFKDALKVEEKYHTKTLLVLDYQGVRDVSSTSLPASLGVIYVGDLFGPRMDLDQKSPVARIIKETLSHKKIEISPFEYVFPVSIPDVADTLVRWLFSFGPYGQEIVLLGPKISTQDFFRELSGVVSGVAPSLKENTREERESSFARYTINTNIRKWLVETFTWFVKLHPVFPAATREEKSIDARLQLKKINFPLKLSALLGFLVLLSPLLVLVLSLVLLGSGVIFIKLNKLSFAEGSLRLASLTSSVSTRESSLFVSFPLLGTVYQPIVRVSRMANRVSEIGEDTFALEESVGGLFSKISGNDVYNPSFYTSPIQTYLDSIYQKLSLLKSDFGPADDFETKLVGRFIDYHKLTETVRLVGETRQMMEQLPDFLGKNKKKTYLVLLQNNMELRPAGGFIGSYALVTFSGGKLSDIAVSDVYSADGQLKGHVDPPDPINKYLKEGGWYLRDSNWDPDFPSSASKAEWFLDKEVDQSVDGVISVDLATIKNLLVQTGPISLSDFNTVIDANNLYEKTQAEVQDNFFPGSQKKGSFLTALTRQLLNTFSSGNNDYVGLIRTVYSSLEGRHIQIFLHDGEMQKNIQELGWDGSVSAPVCSGNCYADWFGLAEANVGVNKANYSLERRMAVDVGVSGTTISRQLFLNFDNKAASALGEKGKYKVYVRLLTPATSEVGNVLLNFGTRKTSLVPDVSLIHGRKESGVYVEILPGETAGLVFFWKDTAFLSFSQKGEYRILWRKQAGTLADPAVATFHFPSGTFLFSSPTPTLTRGPNVSYNTSLAQDFEMSADW